ncbi:hypothetical protein FOA52_012166 [Chlamydomonas sp. UWO 241]|nr:hypothetical protein FOA52_012166 [Chlamydomonas sp. UWO 241]
MSSEFSTLRRSLGMRSELHSGGGASGVLDNQAKLLQQLSRSHQEGTRLAVQLAEAQQVTQELQARITLASGKLQAAHSEAEDARAQAARATAELTDALDAAEGLQHEARTAHADLADALVALRRSEAAKSGAEQAAWAAEQEAALQSQRAEAARSELRSAKAASRSAMDSLKEEVHLAVSRSEARDAAATEKVDSLQRELARTRAGAADARRAAEEEAVCVAALHAAEVGELRALLRSSEEAGARALAAAHARVEAATTDARESSAARSLAEVDAADAKAAVSELQRQLEAVHSELSSVRSTAVAVEEDLLCRLEEAAEDDERLNREVDEAIAEARAARGAVAEQAVAAAAELAAAAAASSAELAAADRAEGEARAKGDAAEACASELGAQLTVLRAEFERLHGHTFEQVGFLKSKLARAEVERRQLQHSLAGPPGGDFLVALGARAAAAAHRTHLKEDGLARAALATAAAVTGSRRAGVRGGGVGGGSGGLSSRRAKDSDSDSDYGA